MQTNRVVAIAATIISLALAVLPVAANMDWTSTAGILAGVIAVLGVTQKWLEGWQKHEDRTLGQKVKLDVSTDEADEDLVPELDGLPEADPDALPPDKGDKGSV